MNQQHLAALAVFKRRFSEVATNISTFSLVGKSSSHSYIYQQRRLGNYVFLLERPCSPGKVGR
jgi:hypothetical protein